MLEDRQFRRYQALCQLEEGTFRTFTKKEIREYTIDHPNWKCVQEFYFTDEGVRAERNSFAQIMIAEQVKIDQHKSTMKIVISEKQALEKDYVETLQVYGTQFDIMLNMYMQKINSNMVRFYSKNSYYTGLRLTVDYLNDLSYECELVRPAVYIENYKQAFIDGNNTLEIRDVIKKSYDPLNFDNDEAFGCFSVAHRFEFKKNEHVIKIKEFDEET